MKQIPGHSAQATHSVDNQPGQVDQMGLWDRDHWLQHWLDVCGGQSNPVSAYASKLDTPEFRAAGRTANRHPPELVTFDRSGRRIDEVHFHPAYHQQMEAGLAAGYATMAFEGGAGGHASHAAMVYLLNQVDPGVCCPLTMTYAGIAVLSEQSNVSEWVRLLKSRNYDPPVQPVQKKAGATLGMAMTEKQGGSDVRTNSTKAEKKSDGWRLTGHKWFCSAPMSDGFLTLAKSPESSGWIIATSPAKTWPVAPSTVMMSPFFTVRPAQVNCSAA